MKHILILLLALLLAIGLVSSALTGCCTYGQGGVAYKAAGVTAVTADGAMKAWAMHVATGGATKPQEAEVKRAYLAYQAAMKALIDAHAVAATDEEKAKLQTSAANVVGAQANLVATINSHLPATKKLK